MVLCVLLWHSLLCRIVTKHSGMAATPAVCTVGARRLMWNGTVHCMLLYVLQLEGQKDRLLFGEEQAQWFTDISGFTIQVLKLPQQQCAINYILDYPRSQLLTYYLPFIGMDNRNYTVFCSICIMLVWIVYVFFLCVEQCCQNE